MNPNSGMIAEAEALKPKLEALNGPKLKELIAEAEQMNDLDPEVMAYLLYLLLEKSPNEATLLGTELLMNATGFNEELAMTIGHAFEAWMKSDPAAADKWYLAAMASGALIPKSLPEAGSEKDWQFRSNRPHRGATPSRAAIRCHRMASRRDCREGLQTDCRVGHENNNRVFSLPRRRFRPGMGDSPHESGHERRRQ